MERKTLVTLLDQYEAKQKLVSDNRKESRALLEENRKIKEEIQYIKEEIHRMVTYEIAEGKSLYQVAKECFGEIDRRFYLLYSILPGK